MTQKPHMKERKQDKTFKIGQGEHTQSQKKKGNKLSQIQ